MKNVLFISYYFPPMGGAGVQRNSAPFEPWRWLGTHLKTSRLPQTGEKPLDSGQFKSTVSCLQGDCPLEDGQVGDPGSSGKSRLGSPGKS